MSDLPLSRTERLVQQFYQWEIRGRGWLLWDEAVRLEPPFCPFVGHYLPTPAYDDGRKPTLLTKLVERLSTALSPPASPIETPLEPESEPGPEAADPDLSWTTLKILLPGGEYRGQREGLEQFLLSLSYCQQPLCLELVGSSEAIRMQFAVATEDLALVEPQLASYFPGIVFARAENPLPPLSLDSQSGPALVVDFGLSREFMLPLGSSSRHGIETLTGILGALSFLQPGETGLFQVMFEPVKSPWAESIIRSVTRADGGHFFANAPEFVPETRRKIARPLYSVGLRIACHSPNDERTWQLARTLAAGLSVLANPLGNEFIPLDNEGYDLSEHVEDTLKRRARRSGMILNSDELISLIQFSLSSAQVPKLERLVRKTKPAPDLVSRQGIVLGVNTHNGEERAVRLEGNQRVRHLHVVGASGTGKSTFLLNLIQQDLENGEGVAVLDPHGDLIDEIIARMPEHRLGDVILLDPADEAYPIGFNILSAHSDLEKNLLSSDLVAVFRRLSTSWGDQMTSVLGNAILAFLESSIGGTLADLRRFLVEPGSRVQFLATVGDPEVVYYWQKEFPLLTGKPQAPLLTRLDAFLRPRTIRYMVAQKENRLDFADIMNGRKIFLAKLSQGAIGEENSYLLGSLIVSKIHQMVMGRQELKEAERQRFFLYIDEFHHFVTPSMANTLTGARKYGLGLILAHQELRQLENRDSDVASAVISNPYTRVCFRLGDQDARKLADGFSSFDAKDLQNLGTGEAICRVERADFDFNLKVPLPNEVDEATKEEQRARAASLTRQTYGTPREQVEAKLAETRVHVEPVQQRKVAEAVAPAATPSPSAAAEPAEKPTAPLPERIVPEARKPAVAVKLPPTLGRGSPKHKYLQHLIKQWAEGMGYLATIEKPTRDAQGSVDIALEKDKRRIACEICVGSSVEQETKNLKKCLADEFDYVVVVSQEEKQLEKLRGTLSAEISVKDATRTRFCSPDDLFSFVQGLEATDAGGETTVKGYKVQVKYRSVEPRDMEARKRVISQVIVDGMKKLTRKAD